MAAVATVPVSMPTAPAPATEADADREAGGVAGIVPAAVVSRGNVSGGDIRRGVGGCIGRGRVDRSAVGGVALISGCDVSRCHVYGCGVDRCDVGAGDIRAVIA